MCLPTPKMPDMSAQIKAQQDALKEESHSNHKHDAASYWNALSPPW